ncbi:MAG: ROK family protein [Phycisphaerales bacterium]
MSETSYHPWSLGIDIGGSSVKLALISDGADPHTLRGDKYEMPTLELLSQRVTTTFDALLKQSGLSRGVIGAVGVSVAGPMDKRGVIEMAANLPVLAGVCIPDWAEATLRLGVPVTPATDANSAAACEHRRNPMPGRTLYLSLGTGVGGAVLDDGRPVIITRGTSGHFGHMDVSGGDPEAPSTPGAGRGALEAYVGFRTLEAAGVPFTSDERFDHPVMQAALAALARGLRILLAVYRPDHVVLMGGTVEIYSPALDKVKTMAEDGLTKAAPARWTLSVGQADNFAAAIGAATLAVI